MDIPFEAEHVRRACEARLASDFIRDAVLEEDVQGILDEAVESLFPDGVTIGLKVVS